MRFGGQKMGKLQPSTAWLPLAPCASHLPHRGGLVKFDEASGEDAPVVFLGGREASGGECVALRTSDSFLLFRSASSHISVRHEARERCPRISMTKWLVAENFRASTPCAFAVFSMEKLGRDPNQHLHFVAFKLLSGILSPFQPRSVPANWGEGLRTSDFRLRNCKALLFDLNSEV